VEALGAARRDPVGMKDAVDIVDSTLIAATYLGPKVAEAHEVFAAALRAGAVASGQGRRLVQEEQLGEPTRTEQWPAAALELEPTGDPSTNLPRADQLAVLVVEDAAVSEEQPTSFRRDDLSERRDPIAQRHGATWYSRQSHLIAPLGQGLDSSPPSVHNSEVRRIRERRE
jgi:hypothetical protein